MNKMNTIGNDIVTHYGPEFPIKAVMFIDDDTGTGGITTADNTINNCGIIEDKNIMTFNNQGEETKEEIMISFFLRDSLLLQITFITIFKFCFSNIISKQK